MSKKPDFIFVGPGRSGTTFIYNYLNKHPQVCLAKDVKEINFFNELKNKKSIDWYLSFFSSCSKDCIAGEISNMYFYDKTVPEEMVKHLPDVKVVTILRNPYERVLSAYQYRLSVGEITDESFEEALSKYPDLIDQNRYYTLLSKYYEVYKPEQIFVLFYDDLKVDNKAFLEQVNSILEIEDVDYQILEKQKNARQAPRSKLLSKLLRYLSDLLRKLHLYKLHTFLKNNFIVRRLAFKRTNETIDINESAKEMLQDGFRDEISKLEAFTKRDLSSWTL